MTTHTATTTTVDTFPVTSSGVLEPIHTADALLAQTAEAVR
jgi:hypothetical protein